MNLKRGISALLITFVVSVGVFAETLQCYDGGKVDVGVWGNSITATSTSPKKQTIEVIVLFEDGSQSGKVTFTVNAASVDTKGNVISTGYSTKDMGKKIARLIKCDTV
jgi:hypothetical protein